MLTGSTSLESFWQRAHNNLSYVAKSRHRNFWLYELSVWLHVVANTMLAIYVPILMLQSGFSLADVLLFYVLFHAINTPSNVGAGYLVGYIGARKTIILATLFQIAFFVAYAWVIPNSFTSLILLGILAALYDALYYTASMYLFMHTTIDIEQTGKNTGILHTVIRSAGIIGPIIGSSILILGGNSLWVIMVVIFVFFCSLLPLLWISLEQGERVAMMPFGEFIRMPTVLTHHLSLGLFKIHEVSSGVIWPIFIFLFFGTIESVAVLALLVPGVALVISYFSGYIRPHRRYSFIAGSALIVALIWIGRIFFEDASWYYFSVVLATMVMIFMQVPIDANIFRIGNQTNALTTAVMKNMVSMGTKTLLFLILYLVAISFSAKFAVAATALILLALLSFALAYREYYIAKS
ncbi:MAG: MFS transporter [Patescibacteria group bacterium]